jgi:hypothetical protein
MPTVHDAWGPRLGVAIRTQAGIPGSVSHGFRLRNASMVRLRGAIRGQARVRACPMCDKRSGGACEKNKDVIFLQNEPEKLFRINKTPKKSAKTNRKMS